MESDPNAVEFVKYAYSCAMPPGKHMTLTINGEAVTFDGSLGLAPEWGEDNGSCNVECQRWVSACLLARTNAYGAHVEISLRAPRSLFQANGDIDALERTKYLQIAEDADPTKDEATLFPLREGAYFGNIFESATASDGTQINSPKYYACAGPGSTSRATNRFCSSQGRVHHLHGRRQFHHLQSQSRALDVGHVHRRPSGLRRHRRRRQPHHPPQSRRTQLHGRRRKPLQTGAHHLPQTASHRLRQSYLRRNGAWRHLRQHGCPRGRHDLSGRLSPRHLGQERRSAPDPMRARPLPSGRQ
jgi:hypothetical protein